MDIQLPVLDGYEATRRIKADPALKAIPIIAVTSYALRATRRRRAPPAATATSPSPSARASSLPRCASSWRAKDEPVRQTAPHPRRRRQAGEPRHPERAAGGHGYEVMTAADGEEALARARELCPT